MNIAVVTTFPNNSWQIYSKAMLESYAKFWPQEIPLMVQLDDDLLAQEVDKILRQQDGLAVGWEPEHKAFVERNKDKDDPQNYRKQSVRFCHKVFALHRAITAANKQKEAGLPSIRYLIWLDADVHTTRAVTLEDIKQCLPKKGDAVAYLGRKDWEHSECGWLVFDLENGGDSIITTMHQSYINDLIFLHDQWHDSWVFDKTITGFTFPAENPSFSALEKIKATNLTADKPGMEIWPHSPMASWSIHYKGPQAKAELAMKKQPPVQSNMKQPIKIQTQNAIPNEEICRHIEENQKLIKNWIHECSVTDEEIVVVSAGPMLIAEDVRAQAGKKIVAVKHALEPLKRAGITPWACILLDPREHVADFVVNPDKEVLWFVASQVNPEVTKRLLLAGCTVWGYHASVNAGEAYLTDAQISSVVNGGSATATRGLFLLNRLGFQNFILYGYDLCSPDKPDLGLRDNLGQPKYLELSVESDDPLFSLKRCFWSEPQLIAQFEEMNQIITLNKFNIVAYGDGIIPFLVKMKKTVDLRRSELRGKIGNGKLSSYRQLLKWNQNSRPSTSWPNRAKRMLSSMRLLLE